jgi:SHS family lactate transporter-like MFS transporter
VPNYALIQGIFIGVVAAYVIVLALIGPENHGNHFERGKTAFQAGASKEDVISILTEAEGVQGVERSSVGSESGKEKDAVQHVENAGPARDNPV